MATKNKSDGFGGGGATGELISEDDLVWAVSKPDVGPGYTLSREQYGVLVGNVSYVRERLEATRRFVTEARSHGTSLLSNEGCLTPLGLLADYFNLVKVRKFEEHRVLGKWILPKGSTPKARPEELQILCTKVLAVLDKVSEGLRRRVLFRGINPEENPAPEGRMILGAVNKKRLGMQRDRGSDQWFPEKDFETKTSVFGAKYAQYGKMPSLQDDEIFVKGKALTGHMHLAYQLIGEIPKDIQLDIFNGKGTCVKWTIIHEATHKFARTRDIDEPACYEVKGRRKMHWTSAVRNAAHYEQLVGLDWTVKPDKAGDGFVYQVGKMVPA